MTKLNGALNLSRIPKHLIKTGKNGDKYLYIDVVENFRGADQYGNTHTITCYDKENNKYTYLANLKPLEPKPAAAPAPAPAPANQNGNDPDLPF